LVHPVEDSEIMVLHPFSDFYAEKVLCLNIFRSESIRANAIFFITYIRSYFAQIQQTARVLLGAFVLLCTKYKHNQKMINTYY